mgnify:CR=1 FL=1
MDTLISYFTATLTAVTFFPLLGVFVILLWPGNDKNAIRWIATITALITFGLSLVMLAQFDPNGGMQMEVYVPWVRAGLFNINFHLGVDGLSVLLVFLSALLSPIAIFASWHVEERVKEYMVFFLLLETGMIGVFVALDLFLFYIFWEFTLVPMYFLIGIWGGQRRLYAAIKFVLYTLAGSILMLLAIIWLGIYAGTFSVTELLANPIVDPQFGRWLFLAFAAAFVIKVPMWPLHSWLPDAHVEAPTAGSVILAGVLLKLGSYGLARFNLGFFPEAAQYFAPMMAWFAVIGIIYGAIVSFPQTDAKKLVAYSSVSHMGFVILGLFALNEQGIQGALLQMVNHGLSTGALFLLVGVIYERRHTRLFSEFGGLWKIMPIYGVLTLIVALSSMGLPGLNGFMGEFPILLGAFGSETLRNAPLLFGTFSMLDNTLTNGPLFAVLGALGVILAAVYLFTMFQKMFLGPVTNPKNEKLSDMDWREVLTVVPLLIMIFWIGLYPQPFFDLMGPAVNTLVQSIHTVQLVGLP